MDKLVGHRVRLVDLRLIGNDVAMADDLDLERVDQQLHNVVVVHAGDLGAADLGDASWA